MASNGNYDIRYAHIPITIDSRIPEGEIYLRSRVDDFRGWDAFAEEKLAARTPEEERASRAEEFMRAYMPELIPKPFLVAFQEEMKSVWNSDTLSRQFYDGNPFLVTIDPLLAAQQEYNRVTGKMLNWKQLTDQNADLREFELSAARSKARRNKPRRAKLGIGKRFSRRRKQVKQWWEDKVAWRYAKERPYDEDW